MNRRERCPSRSRNGHRCHLRAQHTGPHTAFEYVFKGE